MHFNAIWCILIIFKLEQLKNKFTGWWPKSGRLLIIIMKYYILQVDATEINISLNI